MKTVTLICLFLALIAVAAGQENRGRILDAGFPVKPGDGVIAKWPEVVGLTGENAAEAIQKSRPDLRQVTVIPEGSMVTRDMRFDRVRVFVNDDGKVVTTPRVG